MPVRIKDFAYGSVENFKGVDTPMNDWIARAEAKGAEIISVNTFMWQPPPMGDQMMLTRIVFKINDPRKLMM